MCCVLCKNQIVTKHVHGDFSSEVERYNSFISKNNRFCGSCSSIPSYTSAVILFLKVRACTCVQ